MDLVHAIQLERGCSCAWVGGGGKSEYFQKLVMTHREQANAALQREGGRLEPQHRKEIMERLSYLRDTADRSTAAVLSNTCEDENDRAAPAFYAILTGYSDTVEVLMEFGVKLGLGSFKKGTRTAFAADHFAKLKELMGFERAFICGALALPDSALPELPQRSFADLVLCLTRLKIEKQLVRSEAPPHMLQLLEAAFELHPDLHAIQETLLRDFDVLALKRSGLTVTTWWKLITAHIDRMHEFQVVMEEASPDWATSPELPAAGAPPPSSIHGGTNSELSSANPQPVSASRRKVRDKRFSSENPEVAPPSRKWPATVRAQTSKSPTLTQAPSPHELTAPPSTSADQVLDANLVGRLGITQSDADGLAKLSADSIRQALLSALDRGSNAPSPSPKRAPPTILSVALHPSLADQQASLQPLRHAEGEGSRGSSSSSPPSQRESVPQRRHSFGEGTKGSPSSSPSSSPPGERESVQARRHSDGDVSVKGLRFNNSSHSKSPETSRRWRRNPQDAANDKEISMEKIALSRRIGSGGFSTTYKATWRRDGAGADAKPINETVAVKVASCADESFEQWRAELQALTKLSHPNVVRYLGYAATPPTFCIILEFLPGGDLQEALKKPTPAGFTLRIAKGLIAALAYLHKQRLIHRDVKSPNVLIATDAFGQPTPKLTDFGVAIQLSERTVSGGHSLTAETGTYRYMAPEVIRHEPYSTSADIFSYALVLSELIMHREVWGGLAPLQAAAKIALEDERPALPSDVPSPILHIITRAWSTKPEDRPTAAGLVDELEVVADYLTPADHKWLDAPTGHAPNADAARALLRTPTPRSITPQNTPIVKPEAGNDASAMSPAQLSYDAMSRASPSGGHHGEHASSSVSPIAVLIGGAIGFVAAFLLQWLLNKS